MPDGKYINGTTIIVDGGLWLSHPRHLAKDAVKDLSRTVEKRSRATPIGIPTSKMSWTLVLYKGHWLVYWMAQDLSVGSFPVDDEDVNLAKSILDKAKSKRVKILLPSQVVVVDRFTYYGKNKVVAASAIPDGWTGVDIGPESVDLIKNALDSAKTVMWEGAEIYEFGKFTRASETISKKVFELGDKGVKTFIGVETETGSSEIEYTRTVGEVYIRGCDKSLIGFFHFTSSPLFAFF
ncbi:3-phosphoglycerate kinase [Olea europaea subsp. europaea]|uniref:phosphoglycerate kinase n=1 Tax=Olea europaea subsp. europaea TaxID=158383 RepID=A0A8S0R8P7_OLEEU|nr:3-phosphoglycerate kinase [Olea europaea subsp. europaea]